MFYKTFKIIIDYLIAFFLVVILLPLFIIISITIKIDSRGPIFYRVLRVGQYKKQFEIYKFRSMVVNADKIRNGTLKNDARITRIGKTLRKLSLDELPQLFNVLRGEMSLIGPRPHRLELDERFNKEFRDYSIRYSVKPGLSGLAQINGWRGPTETVIQRERRVYFDTLYVHNLSFKLDLYIFFMTIFSVKSLKSAF
jgi:putative colanic acid biosynthesis UDP-glucose lipid carrier transferase